MDGVRTRPSTTESSKVIRSSSRYLCLVVKQHVQLLVPDLNHRQRPVSVSQNYLPYLITNHNQQLSVSLCSCLISILNNNNIWLSKLISTHQQNCIHSVALIHHVFFLMSIHFYKNSLKSSMIDRRRLPSLFFQDNDGEVYKITHELCDPLTLFTLKKH